MRQEQDGPGHARTRSVVKGPSLYRFKHAKHWSCLTQEQGVVFATEVRWSVWEESASGGPASVSTE